MSAMKGFTSMSSHAHPPLGACDCTKMSSMRAGAVRGAYARRELGSDRINERSLDQ